MFETLPDPASTVHFAELNCSVCTWGLRAPACGAFDLVAQQRNTKLRRSC